MRTHQYLRRDDRAVVTERLFADRIVAFLYSRTREQARPLFDLVTSARASRLLAHLSFDLPLASSLVGQRRFLARCGVSLDECLDPPDHFTTPRHIFERKIRYWACRPLPAERTTVVSPADARVLVGSLRTDSRLFLKGKFFDLDELLGRNRPEWRATFEDGDCAIFRLTPDRYHYNHVPVSGVVADFYEIPGRYHACNPGAVVEVATPYSKNKRVVTILETDVPGGSGVGTVALVEIVALMIGQVVQCYSRERYEDPRPIRVGMFLERGAPKSLFRPGSSTDVMLFRAGRVTFADDLVTNRFDPDTESRLSHGFGTQLVETDVRARSEIARPTTERRTA